MSENRGYPKILILSRGVWNDAEGTSSTLTNLFKEYNPDNLAQVYIETIKPSTSCCYRFFQISEFALVHKLFKWRVKTGHVVNTQKEEEVIQDEHIASQEANAISYVRKHRSIWFSIARELLWSLNGWKTKELRTFIENFNPDVVWVNGATEPFLCNLYNYILRIAQTRTVIYMQDDDWSYNSKSLLRRAFKWYHRKTIKRVVDQCDEMFVICPKMKQEYDKVFRKNSHLLTKGIDINKLPLLSKSVHKPIKLVYMGQIIYGRIYSLLAIAEALKDLNSSEIIAQLNIYTSNSIPSGIKKILSKNGNVFIKQPVRYDEVQNVISEHDVVVFVESFKPKYCKTARLSFSTKITDYLSSGKCIFAVGPRDIAPIEYFIEEDAAIVATTKDEIRQQILKLTEPSIIKRYAEKARDCACKNHNKDVMIQQLYNNLFSLKS